jgi:hypothetical protein
MLVAKAPAEIAAVLDEEGMVVSTNLAERDEVVAMAAKMNAGVATLSRAAAADGDVSNGLHQSGSHMSERYD